MSMIILCLWGALSNWILIKYWARETLYLIMKAAPRLPSSGEAAVCSTEWVLCIRRDGRECVVTVHGSVSTVLVGDNWCKVPAEGETFLFFPIFSLNLCQDPSFGLITLSFNLPWRCFHLISPCDFSMRLLTWQQRNTGRVPDFPFAAWHPCHPWLPSPSTPSPCTRENPRCFQVRSSPSMGFTNASTSPPSLCWVVLSNESLSDIIVAAAAQGNVCQFSPSHSIYGAGDKTNVTFISFCIKNLNAKLHWYDDGRRKPLLLLCDRSDVLRSEQFGSCRQNYSGFLKKEDSNIITQLVF